MPNGQTGRITIRLKFLGTANVNATSFTAIPFGGIRLCVTTNGVTGPQQDVPTDCSDD